MGLLSLSRAAYESNQTAVAYMPQLDVSSPARRSPLAANEDLAGQPSGLIAPCSPFETGYISGQC